MTDHLVPDEWDIPEIDGPPRAYFELPVSTATIGEAPGGLAAIERITYHLVQFETATAMEACVQAVRLELGRRYGCGIIWWRHRPSVDRACRPSMRLATSPILPDEVWAQLTAHALPLPSSYPIG